MRHIIQFLHNSHVLIITNNNIATVVKSLINRMDKNSELEKCAQKALIKQRKNVFRK